MNRGIAMLLRKAFWLGATVVVIAGGGRPTHAAEGAVPQFTLSPPDMRGISRLSFPVSETIERADLYFWHPTYESKPKGVLLLAPGRNGVGRKLIEQAVWQAFAREHQLMLCGLSFASDRRWVDESYSNAYSGSGAMVLFGIDAMLKAQGAEGAPILAYGFSAGARFTAGFVESYSERILGWCAGAVGKWERARETKVQPPGIVASGEWDAGCYHASLLYFQQGRKLGKPWIWLSLEETGHRRSPALDVFVQEFFTEVLSWTDRGEQRPEARYYDIDTRKRLTQSEMEEWPIFATWLPEGPTEAAWLELHHP
ncbi:MAG: hypothetical protein HRU46_18705 [Verrucomicrobiales bacterium]|nr:hypothetical protein [Verrucomicrobiales bacterium]